jgi:hypothetical protein
MSHSTLLLVDAAINLVLGVLLLAFPRQLVALLGLPDAATTFYPNVLGGVLFGIGLALLIESRKPLGRATGLGVAGAIAINLCGGIVLALWLVSGRLSIPARGRVALGLLDLLLFAISAFELRAQLTSSRSGGPGN